MNEIKLSIITINLNNKVGLEKTIKSLISQTFTDFEYLLIDGGSTDGSLEVIKRHEEKITYWLSEKDNGIYNAMNKGIIQAKGLYCLFLNSGDFFLKSEVLKNCFACFNSDIIYCNFIYNRKGIGQIYKPPSSITFYDFFVGTICHQSAFIKRELFTKVGLYNENFRIVSDWEFFLRAIFIHNCSTQYLDQTIVNFEGEGIASNNYDVYLAERQLVLEELFPRFIPDYKKQVHISEFIQIHSGNKYIRKFADIINWILALRQKKKSS